MLKTIIGYEDGITSREYLAGEIYEVNDEFARGLLNSDNPVCEAFVKAEKKQAELVTEDKELKLEKQNKKAK